MPNETSTSPSIKETQSFAAMERLENVELSKLLLSIIDKLIQLQPEIEKLGDGKLKGELMEICLTAKQVKKLIGG